MAKVGYRLPGCNFALFSSFSIFMVIITEASNSHRIKNKTTHISEHTCKQYTASKPRCITHRVSQKPAHALFITFTHQQINYCIFKCTCQVKPQVFDLESKSSIRSLRVLTCFFSLFLLFFLFFYSFHLSFFLSFLVFSIPILGIYEANLLATKLAAS